MSRRELLLAASFARIIWKAFDYFPCRIQSCVESTGVCPHGLPNFVPRRMHEINQQQRIQVYLRFQIPLWLTCAWACFKGICFAAASTVLNKSICQSHVTGPPKSAKCHSCPIVTVLGGETILSHPNGPFSGHRAR